MTRYCRYQYQDVSTCGRAEEDHDMPSHAFVARSGETAPQKHRPGCRSQPWNQGSEAPCNCKTPAEYHGLAGVAPANPAPPSPILRGVTRDGAEHSRNAAEGAQRARRDLGSPVARRDAPRRPLTGRELEILGLVADGLTNAEIAEKLVLSRWTVKSHLARVAHQMPAGVLTTRTGMVGWALRSRLIP